MDIHLVLRYILLIYIKSSTLNSCQIKNGDSIDCSYQNWSRVKNFLFSYKNNFDILEIDISFVYIPILEGKCFERYVNVSTLYLRENKLQTLKTDSFKGLNNLKNLHINSNILRRIPSNIFTSLPNLQVLNLNRNYIYKIGREDFNELKLLQKLYLSNNLINWISKLSFLHITNRLRTLDLSNNNLTEVPTIALKRLPKLKVLDISDNPITFIQRGAFQGMVSLRNIILSKHHDKHNKILIDHLAFQHLPSLRILNLNYENIILESFPSLTGTDQLKVIKVSGIDHLTIPDSFCDEKKNLSKIVVQSSTMKSFPLLSKCLNLVEIDFYRNQINSIPEKSFSGLPHVDIIDLLQKQNDIAPGEIHQNAFSNLPSLKELDLSHYQLKVFPNLTGTTNLKYLRLPRCKITSLPKNFCSHLPNIHLIDLSFNGINELPSLTKCSNLETLYLVGNRISWLDSQLSGLNQLEYLILSDNYIQDITVNTLASLVKLRKLIIKENLISNIHMEAFKNILNLELLDLSYNKLNNLPSLGLQSVIEINVTGNKALTKFPSQEELPHARQLDLVYPYHCCYFMKNIQQINSDMKLQFLSSESNWTTLPHSIIPDEIPAYLKDGNSLSEEDILEDFMEPLLRSLNNNTLIYFEKPTNLPAIKDGPYKSYNHKVYCSPTPNEFYPCEDLMGKEWLRVCVWIVFSSALFGNIIVFFTLAMNLGRKADVPKYLVMNLAFADLCLAVYLGFLAFVDMMTLGDFRQHALEWQFSNSCNAAGFLAIFSSELSVYTLTLITVERFTTIKHSMRIDKKITKKQAAIVLVIGWVISLALASLPLLKTDNIKFSDYTKYSVCLPFDVTSLTSKAYVSFLLVLNTIAFLIILVCYVKIYLFIRGSNAWNSGDSKVARRMAILVFTDFACWFPISVVALFAVYGKSLIDDLWISKVLTILIFPLNACANPFLYAIFTKTFRKDFVQIIKQVKEKSNRSRDLSKSLLKLPIKGSLTYSTSVRRESSCSFLFGRRTSSKPDDIKCQSKTIVTFKHQCDELERQERNETELLNEANRMEERLTSL